MKIITKTSKIVLGKREGKEARNKSQHAEASPHIFEREKTIRYKKLKQNEE